MDRKHTRDAASPGAGGVGGVPVPPEERDSAAPVETGRYPRTADAPAPNPGFTDPELETDLGAEFEFRGDVLEGELESARRLAAAHLDTAQRLQAEFDNYRKRVARDSEDAAKRAGQRVIAEILPALDNLERAIAHVEAGGDGAQLVGGVRMVIQQVLDVFGKEGVERIVAVGEQFDPAEHQAVGQAERTDVPEGTVVESYQHGYRMHGRVLRPATVVVSTGGPAPEE